MPWLIHSQGPWKHHKYVRKVGSGESAKYYYRDDDDTNKHWYTEAEAQKLDQVNRNKNEIERLEGEQELLSEQKRRQMAAYDFANAGVKREEDRLNAEGDKIWESYKKQHPIKSFFQTRNDVVSMSPSDVSKAVATHTEAGKEKARIEERLARIEEDEQRLNDAKRRVERENKKLLSEVNASSNTLFSKARDFVFNITFNRDKTVKIGSKADSFIQKQKNKSKSLFNIEPNKTSRPQKIFVTSFRNKK